MTWLAASLSPRLADNKKCENKIRWISLIIMFDIKRILFLNCKNVWNGEIYLCLNLFVAMAGVLWQKKMQFNYYYV